MKSDNYFLVEALQVAKSYGSKTVLQPIDLKLSEQERLAIIGETGSGKTTLLKALAGLVDLSGGTVVFDQKRVPGPSEVLLPGQPGISYLTQSVNLRNHYKVVDLLERHSIQALQDDLELAQLCRIEHLLDRMTDELSGGERQRIGLAIELSKKPSVLLLDEPFSNLDIGHRNVLREVLDDLHRKNKLTIVIVSHNPSEILGWADRILVMRHGQYIQSGKPEEIYLNPIDAYTAQLLGPYSLIQVNSENTPSIVRPEKLSFLPSGEKITEGVVEKIEFEGPSFLYVVKTATTFLYVRTAHCHHKIGETLTIFVQENTF